jgi:hypothetical protein
MGLLRRGACDESNAFAKKISRYKRASKTRYNKVYCGVRRPFRALSSVDYYIYELKEMLTAIENSKIN